MTLNRMSIFFMVPLITCVGCAVGLDFKRPVAPNATNYSSSSLIVEPTVSADTAAGQSQHFNAAMDIPFDWWTLYKSEQLNTLIKQAFAANPSIESAQAALRQAQQNSIAQSGFLAPTIGVNYSPSRNKIAGNNGASAPGIQSDGSVIQAYANPAGPAPFNGPVYYNFHVAQLMIGYDLDFFGQNRRLIEYSQSQVNWQKLQMEATYITLATNVVATAIQEASLRAQLAALNKIARCNEEGLAILQKQFQLGAVSKLEVAAQESALAFVVQSIIPLQKQLDLTRDLLTALAGNLPDKELDEKFNLEDLQLPEELPLSLPSKLVEQRPDVRAAEEQLHSVSAQAGVAIANTLPQFSISAAIGGLATHPEWMFRSGGGFFDVTANVAYTIFDGGTLRAKSRGAQEALTQAGAQYRSTVITALQNVADTLHIIQADANQLKAALASEQATQLTVKLTRKQYEVGSINYQTLLVAEQSYQMALINLIQAQASRFTDTAALYQALGGGWWNRKAAHTEPVLSTLPLVFSPSVPGDKTR